MAPDSINFSNFHANVTKLGLSDNVDIRSQSGGDCDPLVAHRMCVSRPREGLTNPRSLYTDDDKFSLAEHEVP